MKKFIIVLVVVMVVVLGLFFWSVNREDAGEAEQSGTLVMATAKKLERGGGYV